LNRVGLRKRGRHWRGGDRPLSRVRGLNRGAQSRLLNRFDLGPNSIVFVRLDSSIGLVSATPLLFDEDGVDAKTRLVGTERVHNIPHGKRPNAIAALEVTWIEHTFGDFVEHLAGQLVVSKGV